MKIVFINYIYLFTLESLRNTEFQIYYNIVKCHTLHIRSVVNLYQRIYFTIEQKDILYNLFSLILFSENKYVLINLILPFLNLLHIIDLFKLYLNMLLFARISVLAHCFWSHFITTFINYLNEYFSRYVIPNMDIWSSTVLICINFLLYVM